MERCIYKQIDMDIINFFTAYTHYTKGFLPEPGGIGDQPATFVEAAKLVQGCLNKIEKDQFERRRRELAAGRK